MFDIGFLELALIAIVGLLVVGPDRLPDAVKSSIRVITKFKRFMRDTKQEIETQIGADEIRRELHNEEVLKSIEALKVAQREMEESAGKIKRDISDDPTLGTDENTFSDPSLAHYDDDERERHDYDPNNDPDDEHDFNDDHQYTDEQNYRAVENTSETPEDEKNQPASVSKTIDNASSK